jgi:hypothetical protein
VTHGLGTTAVIAQVFDVSGAQVQPESVIIERPEFLCRSGPSPMDMNQYRAFQGLFQSWYRAKPLRIYRVPQIPCFISLSI